MAILVNGKKVAGIGLPGKSAYQTAVEGGYTGTESEFNQILANPATKPICRTVTLSSSAWSSNSQTATVEGVNANTTGQIIDWGAHDQDSYTALASAQLFISASTSANQLVFTALGEVPTSNVQIDIRIQEAQGV